MIDLDNLEKLAKAATPGPWCLCESDQRPDVWYVLEDAAERNVAKVMEMGGFTRPNAAYLRESNPAVILSLLAELRAARECIEYMRGGWDDDTVFNALDKYDAATKGQG